ncbi:MAG: DUF4369 domain-containing protein [Bacteroidales bacterium]|nr:DUF4369 domain-containing protein [Bacteroidales bacterium]
MRKKVLFITALAVVLICSCGKDTYRIHGRVTSNELEGVKVFLVPVGHEERENVDSVLIHNHEFEFTGTRHWMCTVRLIAHERHKGQDLLVATEPGDIFVTIGPDSRGGGTPLNDSLQVWKDLTIEHNRLYGRLYDAGMKEEAKAEREAYKQRTREMALAVGEKSILGEFLLNLYPLPASQDTVKD